MNAPTAVQGGLTSAQRTAIVNAALKYAGQDIPYVWGGKTPAGFDCSGLAAWVFNDAGLSLPSYTVSEEAYVSTTDVKTPADVMATAQPGDLLFWVITVLHGTWRFISVMVNMWQRQHQVTMSVWKM